METKPEQDSTLAEQTHRIPLPRIILLFLVVFYVTLGFLYLDKYPIVYLDETFYTEPTVNFLEQGKFSSSCFAIEPVGGFHKSSILHGRLFSLAQSLFIKGLGLTVLTMRLLSFICGLGVLLLTFLITKEIFQKETLAILVTFLLAFSHLFIFASHFARPDMMVTLFVLGTLFSFLQAQKKNSFLLYFLSGLAGSLSFDVHTSGTVASFVLFGLVLQGFLSKTISIKAFLFVVLGLSLGVAWYAALHILIDPTLFYEQYSFLQQFGYGGSYLRPWSVLAIKEIARWKSFFWLGAYHRNMFLLLLFLISFCYALYRRDERGNRIILFSIFSAILGYTLFAPHVTPWYIIFIYPFLLILTSKFLYDFFISSDYRKKSVTVVLGSSFALFLALENCHRLRFYRSDYDAFVAKIREHIPSGATILSNDNYWVGLRDHTKRFVGQTYIGSRELMINKNIFKEYTSESFDEFLWKLRIEYIVADEEVLNFTINHGTVLPFISRYCELIAQIEDPFYGNSDYMSKRSPRLLVTNIYKVKPAKAVPKS